MSNAQPNDGQGIAVIITREQRDAIHHEIRNYELEASGPLGDFANCLEWTGHGAEAQERWQRIARAARMLGDIGWDVQGDRDSYGLTIDVGTLEEWARDRLELAEAALAGYAETFADVRAGRDPWARYGRRGPGEGTIEDDLDDVRALADRDLEIAGACRAILEQLERKERGDGAR